MQEIKIDFGILNYLLPDRDVMPMHCSANVGSNGDSAIFLDYPVPGKRLYLPTSQGP